MMIKIGDKVRIKKGCWHEPSRGHTGKIIDGDGTSWKVQMDESQGFKNIFVAYGVVELTTKVHTCIVAVLCSECLKNVKEVMRF